MTRERTITRLQLGPVVGEGGRHWVEARWQRSDGSKGNAYAELKRRTADTWGITSLRVDAPTTALLADVPLARIENAANADSAIRAWLEEGLPPPSRRRRMRLRRPSSRRLGDSFYMNVGICYRDAVGHGLPPAKTLAEDADTPPGTVNRWIAEARRRGHLAPAKPGRISF